MNTKYWQKLKRLEDQWYLQSQPCLIPESLQKENMTTTPNLVSVDEQARTLTFSSEPVTDAQGTPEEQNAVASIYKFKDRIMMWEKDHREGVRPPMIRTKDGSYIWLNRSIRRGGRG